MRTTLDIPDESYYIAKAIARDENSGSCSPIPYADPLDGDPQIEMTPSTTLTALDMFAPELLPGETIEWSGVPNRSVIFHPEDWVVVPFSLLWGGFTVAWVFGALGIWDVWAIRPNADFRWFGVFCGTPFVLFGPYLIWGRFLYQSREKRRTHYALTSRRALIVFEGSRGRSTSSANFENLSVIDKRVRPDGIGSISFGGPLRREWQWGRRHTPSSPPTFADIDNVDHVYQIALKLQHESRKA